jgi:ADP-glucose pyrophosphorylase
VAQRFGLMRTEADEAIRRPFLALMGIYVFERDTLFNLLSRHPEATDFSKDIIPTALSSGLLRQSHRFAGYWEDIGTIKAFFAANLALTDAQPAFSFYDKTAPIYSRARYLPSSQMHNARIRRSIVGEGCRLDRCVVDHCVLGLRHRPGQAFRSVPVELVSGVQLRAGTGCQLDFAITAEQRLARAAPGFDAHHRAGWFGPQHHQIERVAQLQFEGGAGGVIHQAHRAGRADQQIDAIGQRFHLLCGGG